MYRNPAPYTSDLLFSALTTNKAYKNLEQMDYIHQFHYRYNISKLFDSEFFDQLAPPMRQIVLFIFTPCSPIL